MKAAVIQFRSGLDKKENIHKALALAQQAVARKAKLVCLPELYHYRGNARAKDFRRVISEEIPGESTRPWMALARRTKTFILAGSIYEKDREGRIFNTAVFIDDTGRIQVQYRKIHLFDAVVGDRTFCESKNFSPGEKPAIARAGGFKIGLAVCFDLRFPEMFGSYSKKGCQVLAVPSCFTRKTGQAHWEILLRSRAIENQCYVLAPNQWGTDQKGTRAYGHSMIIGPQGEILAHAQENRDQAIYADLKMDVLLKTRQAMPLKV